MKRYRILVLALGLALGLLGMALLAPASHAPAIAAPPAAPTAVANLVYSPDRNYFDLMDTRTVAADTHTDVMDISAQEWCDFQYKVDQAIDDADVNTTTLTVEYSNDKVAWIDGPALVSNNAADASDITRLPVFGRYAQIELDVTNTATPTWSISAVCK